MAMRLRGNSRATLLLTALLAALPAACSPAPADAPASDTKPATGPRLGLMTSLPLYWPADASLADIAAGRAKLPWQRGAIEARYRLVPLDTLSPIPALSPNAPESDPLGALERLAVVQPRGLSPADNVALDQWVRAGGLLLLALDPALTGEYDLALGDPRRPVDTALIPPVVARWGLAVSFDAAQPLAAVRAQFAGQELPLVLHGTIAIADPAAADCALAASGAVATCKVGKGRVVLIADAALFEHPELAGEGGAGLSALLAAALD